MIAGSTWDAVRLAAGVDQLDLTTQAQEGVRCGIWPFLTIWIPLWPARPLPIAVQASGTSNACQIPPHASAGLYRLHFRVEAAHLDGLQGGNWERSELRSVIGLAPRRAYKSSPHTICMVCPLPGTGP